MTLSTTTKLTVALVALAAFAVAQDNTPAAPAKKFKDDKEQALAIAANKNTDPKGRLEQLEQWKRDYPESEYADARLTLFMFTYGELKRFHDQIVAAQEILRKDPNDLGALRTIFVAEEQIKPPGADDMAAADQAAHYIIEHLDQVFAPEKKPAGQTADQWAQLKPQMKAFAQGVINQVAEARGEDAVVAALKADPTQAELNGWLGRTIISEAKAHPERQPLGLFHFARAAVYAGPNALPADGRAQLKAYLDRVYKVYHGSSEGEDKLLALAKDNALPPDGFTIKDIGTINQEQALADQAKRLANPMMTMWTDIKTALTAADGQTYFDEHVKDAALPKFKGKIVSMTPALRPKTLVVAVEKDGVADCALVFEAALPGKMEPGAEIEFEGIGKAFTKEPYMLTLAVEKEKLTGWTGKNAPAAGKGKAAPKKQRP